MDIRLENVIMSYFITVTLKNYVSYIKHVRFNTLKSNVSKFIAIFAGLTYSLLFAWCIEPLAFLANFRKG